MLPHGGINTVSLLFLYNMNYNIGKSGAQNSTIKDKTA